jgi:hypothetical protein
MVHNQNQISQSKSVVMIFLTSKSKRREWDLNPQVMVGDSTYIRPTTYVYCKLYSPLLFVDSLLLMTFLFRSLSNNPDCCAISKLILFFISLNVTIIILQDKVLGFSDMHISLIALCIGEYDAVRINN